MNNSKIIGDQEIMAMLKLLTQSKASLQQGKFKRVKQVFTDLAQRIKCQFS